MNTAYAVRGRERFDAAVPDMRYVVGSELTSCDVAPLPPPPQTPVEEFGWAV